MGTKIKAAHRRHTIACIAASVTFLVTRTAYAANTGMPWEGPFQQFLQIVTGSVASGIGIAAIIATAAGMALSVSGQAIKRFLSTILGLALALTASTFGSGFYFSSVARLGTKPLEPMCTFEVPHPPPREAAVRAIRSRKIETHSRESRTCR